MFFPRLRVIGILMEVEFRFFSGFSVIDWKCKSCEVMLDMLFPPGMYIYILYVQP